METISTWAAAGKLGACTFTGKDAEYSALWQERLSVLEAFNGQNFRGLRQDITIEVNPNAQPQIKKSYQGLVDYVWRNLVMQTRLAAYFETLAFTETDDGALIFDAEDFAATWNAAFAKNAAEACADEPLTASLLAAA